MFRQFEIALAVFFLFQFQQHPAWAQMSIPTWLDADSAAIKQSVAALRCMEPPRITRVPMRYARTATLRHTRVRATARRDLEEPTFPFSELSEERSPDGHCG